MNITLNEIGKILFVSIQKKLNFQRFAYNFPFEKVDFSLIHPTHITIHDGF